MLGTGNPAPYDAALIALLLALALLLAIGTATAGAWQPATAAWVRRGALLLGGAATVFVFSRTPTSNGIVGAGRMLTVWPALGALLIAYVAWSWRAGRS
jgi:hypothetical protein